MSIKLLEHIHAELKSAGFVRSIPEFCNAWLGRSEGYIRTLRYHDLEPSVAVLSVCSHKLGHYAQRLKDSPKAEHEAISQSFEQLKQLCDQAIAKQSQSIWRQPERMGA